MIYGKDEKVNMAYRVFIDAGHGLSDPGSIGYTGTKEKDINLAIALKLQDILQKQDVKVAMTRVDDSRIYNNDTIADTLARGDKATEFNAHAYVSIHCNAASPSAHGTETFHRYPSATANDVRLAETVHKQVVKALGLTDRKVKSADFMQFRRAYVPACLVELAFISNPEEEALLLSETFQWKIAYAIADGIMIYLKNGTIYEKEEAKVEKVSGTPIIDKPSASLEQMQAWAKENNATETFINLAPIFWEVSEKAGINPIVTYCQSAKETGYGHFGGVLDESYCNPCGMKNASGGGDYDPAAHKQFACWEDGISAQVDHLALYAGAAGYPKMNTLDPRHFSYLQGTAKSVEELGGKWAPSLEYGISLVSMMTKVKAMEVIIEEVKNEPAHWAQAALDMLVTKGIITSPESWSDLDGYPTKGQLLALIERLIKE